MMLIDTHAHLTDEKLCERVTDILARCRQQNVRGVVTVATNLATSRATLELAARFPGVFPSVGIHPNEAQLAEPGDWDAIEALAQSESVVAIGETGLDRYWNDCPWERQVDFFHRHVALGRKLDLPIVIHMRDCSEDMVRELRRANGQGPLRGVMHSFSADLQTAIACLDLGLYISFAGMVTYKKSDALREVAKYIPLDRVLVETDSPYLSPEPVRGRGPNEPANVVHTARLLANSIGISISEFSEITTANTLRLFQRIRPQQLM